MSKILIGYYDKANFITLTGLLSAVSSGYFALRGNLKISAIFLIVAGLCDLFDGFIARKTERTDTEKLFGKELDTITDAVSFCAVPSIIVYSQISAVWYGLLICAFYILCGVIRLSHFNSTAEPDKPLNYYTGLPVTYVALILPVVLLFDSSAATLTVFAVTGLLYILKIKIPKPEGIWYVLFPLTAVILIVLWILL